MQKIKIFLENKNAKIVIWGFGKTGKSYLEFCLKNDFTNITIIDNNEFNEKNISFIFQKDLNKKILESFDYIMLSPGINIRKEIKKLNCNLKNLNKKFILELDLFHYFMKKKEVIAITGTFGKTSITTLLSQILSTKYKILTAGNIGYPLLNLIEEEADFYILEVSSAQLEFTKYFSPKYPIITNICENHLDYHENFENYIIAKCKILFNNSSNIKKFFVSFSTMNAFYNILNFQIRLQSINDKYIGFDSNFYLKDINYSEYSMSHEDFLYVNKRNQICECKNLESKVVFELNDIHKNVTHITNWVCIFTFLKSLNIDISIVNECINNLKIPEHRLELCKESNENLKIYNDAKATVINTTCLAAVKLKVENENKDLIVIVGGLSKGANRTIDILTLEQYAKHIVFFGAEIDLFKKCCNKMKIENFFQNTLEEAVNKSIELANNDGIILFSPGGSSFDLFKSYEDRGNCFKKLISEKIKSC